MIPTGRDCQGKDKKLVKQVKTGKRGAPGQQLSSENMGSFKFSLVASIAGTLSDQENPFSEAFFFHCDPIQIICAPESSVGFSLKIVNVRARARSAS